MRRLFSLSLRDYFDGHWSTQDYVLGYSQPSLRDYSTVVEALGDYSIRWLSLWG